ncbi:hypothetical protein GGF44_004978 [Coemansia sp. RSA 1694]|nr:hypothetical protein GGF44_004978 [Coemansia sp. RSA 1694]
MHSQMGSLADDRAKTPVFPRVGPQRYAPAGVVSEQYSPTTYSAPQETNPFWRNKRPRVFPAHSSHASNTGWGFQH